MGVSGLLTQSDQGGDAAAAIGAVAGVIDEAKLRFSWADLPAATEGIPGTGGAMRAQAEDFAVTEIPSYLPSGSGAHAYAFVEKRGLTTMDIVAALARRGVPRNAVGFAGQKDKYAVARQWFSVPARYADALTGLDDAEGVSVLQTSLHGNKLGLGHLRGNRFCVRARDARGDWRANAERVLARVREVGLPNYFGPQRFGRFNSNAADGLRLIGGQTPPGAGDRRMRRFYMSALQSHLFNLLLAERMRRGLFAALVAGDRAQRHDSGGMFVVDDPTAETERARRLEISAVLPLFGRKARLSAGAAGELERKTLAQFGLDAGAFRGAQGARRISRVWVDDAALTPHDDGYSVEFTLPKGAYATSLMRELVKGVEVG